PRDVPHPGDTHAAAGQDDVEQREHDNAQVGGGGHQPRQLSEVGRHLRLDGDEGDGEPGGAEGSGKEPDRDERAPLGQPRPSARPPSTGVHRRVQSCVQSVFNAAFSSITVGVQPLDVTVFSRVFTRFRLAVDGLFSRRLALAEFSRALAVFTPLQDRVVVVHGGHEISSMGLSCRLARAALAVVLSQAVYAWERSARSTPVVWQAAAMSPTPAPWSVMSSWSASASIAATASIIIIALTSRSPTATAARAPAAPTAPRRPRRRRPSRTPTTGSRPTGPGDRRGHRPA